MRKRSPNEDKTLKAVSRVITSIAERYDHIPYRDSKITRLVKEGFGGTSSAVLILCVRDGAGAFDETMAFGSMLQVCKPMYPRG